jgi:hypothetical protein
VSLTACGGGNPLGNPDDVLNPPGVSGNKLSFAYFQRCVEPVLVARITAPGGATNTCASGGCHSSTTGTGGALRIIDTAADIDLADPANTAESVRASDMYKNFYSAQGVSSPGDATQSRLLAKPLLLKVLHGGGQIFTDDQDPMVKLITYWIEHPAPKDQDEFGQATYNMFTPPDPVNGACKSQ